MDLCKMRPKQNRLCPHCHSEYTVKNGKTYYGKQNHKCKTCNRQFVERQKDPIEAYKEQLLPLLPLLLLERISLRGIERLLGHGMSWIYKRMAAHWSLLPKELPMGRLGDAEVGLYCAEADETWSFVGAKDCKEWVWIAIERRTRLVVGFHVGGRDEEGALGLKLSINPELLDKALVFADDFPAYQSVFAKGQLGQEGKKQTTMIERFNNTIRQRCSRLAKALSFSKKWENHYLAIKYFIVNYNLEKIAKNPSL
ncbi:IS1 family transposase [Flammeovirgaceae bacterium SG7u.111]|nr:IS1 family transposase [Flammeovirgaceae bacterium SG7u.132]WPO38218.1 IS1 family transposase [Flammeovirgaceae bacterium SG7u.111]